MKNRHLSLMAPLLLVALVVAFWVCHVFATKIKTHRSGVVISVPEGLESTDPFSVSIVAGAGVDSPEAALVLMIRDCDENSRDTSTIWAGEMPAGTRIEISHSLSDLPVGRYSVGVSMLFPNTPDGPRSGGSDGFYVEITESGWVVSQEDFRAQELRGIMARMRAAGLDTCTGKQLGIVAPDIRRRLSELGVAWPETDVQEGVDRQGGTPSGNGEQVPGSLGPSRSRTLTPEDSVRLVEKLEQLKAEERQRVMDSLAAGDTLIVDTTLPPKVRPPRVRPPRPDFNGPQGRVLTEEEAAKIREGLARTPERMRIEDSLKADSAKGGVPK